MSNNMSALADWFQGTGKPSRMLTLNPSSQLTHKQPRVRNEATALRATLWIQPSVRICRMIASIHGNPVVPYNKSSHELKETFPNFDYQWSGYKKAERKERTLLRYTNNHTELVLIGRPANYYHSFFPVHVDAACSQSINGKKEQETKTN